MTLDKELRASLDKASSEIESDSIDTDSIGIGDATDAPFYYQHDFLSTSATETTTSTSYSAIDDRSGFLLSINELSKGTMIPFVRYMGRIKIADSGATVSTRLKVFTEGNMPSGLGDTEQTHTGDTNYSFFDTGYMDITSLSTSLTNTEHYSWHAGLKTSNSSHQASLQYPVVILGSLPKGAI